MISLDKDITAGFVGAQAYGRGLAVFQHILGYVINFTGIESFLAFDRDADFGDGEYLLRISELPDSDFAKSRTAISVIPGQFGHG